MTLDRHTWCKCGTKGFIVSFLVLHALFLWRPNEFALYIARALLCSAQYMFSLFLFLLVSANFYWSLLTLTANKKSSDYPEQLRCVLKYYIALYGEKNHKLHVMGFLRIFCTGKGTEITFNDQTSNYRNQRYIGFQFPGQRVKIKIILFSIMTLFIN